MNKLLIITIIFLIMGCTAINAPKDLYDCNNDTDCKLMDKNAIKNDCCAWDAINAKYVDWYNEQEVTCTHTCPMSPVTEAVCENNKCVLKQTSYS